MGREASGRPAGSGPSLDVWAKWLRGERGSFGSWQEILFFNLFYSILFAHRVSQLPWGGAGLGSAAEPSALGAVPCGPQSCPCAAAELQQLKLSLVELIWICSRIAGRRMWSEIALLLPPMAKPVGCSALF